MAVAFPKVYLAAVRPEHNGRKGGEERPWRLPPNHVQDIRDVALGVEESNAGVCCRYLLDTLAGGGSADVDEDGYVNHLHDVERFVERYGDFGKIPAIVTWRHRLRRSRRTITLLRAEGDHRSADVLLVAYGHPDPSTAHLVPLLPREHANLARYTDAVELKRIDLVRAETSKLAARWEAQGDVVRLAARRELFERASRVISSGDGLRLGLEAFTEPNVARGFILLEAVVEGPPRMRPESAHELEIRREARKERQKAHDSKREAFLLDVKLDAHRMLVAAEKAYHKAWLRTGGSGVPVRGL